MPSQTQSQVTDQSLNPPNCLQYIVKHRPFKYAVTVIVVTLALVTRMTLLQWLGERAPLATFYPAVLLAALYGGAMTGLFATTLSAVFASYFCMSPLGSFSIENPFDIFLLSIFIGFCGLISLLSEAIQRYRTRWRETEKELYLANGRKHSEDALRESEEQFRVMFDMASVGMAQADDAGHFLRVNKRFSEITGFPTEELLGKKFTELTHPDDQESDLEAFQRAWRGQIPYYLAEKRYIRADGAVIWVRVNAAIVRDVAGNPLRTVAAIEDITERKRAEEKLAEANIQLEQRVVERTAALESTLKELKEKESLLVQQNRLAAMGEMLNNVAHQWRQPLNVLGLHLQQIPFLCEGNVNETSIIHNVDEAMNHIQHMSRTIDDFRNFFRPNKERISFNLQEAINQTVNLVHDSFKYNNINLELHVDRDVWVLGFPNEFCQALLNILQNARDVLLEREIPAAKVGISAGKQGGSAFIAIRDNAGGIPDDIVGHIFEPYFSTKGVQGTGIGLYMAKSIIEANMGGHVAVRNGPEGAEFSIILPENNKEVRSQGTTLISAPR